MSYVSSKTVVSSGAPAAASGSYIGYDNVFTGYSGTITASSEATGYEKERGLDWRPSTWWKPTATGDSWLRVTLPRNQFVNYFAVAAHNLTESGSRIKLQYSLTGGSSWVDVTDVVPGFNDQTIFIVLDDTYAAAEWRVLVSNPTTISSIGMIAAGQLLDLTKGQKTGFAPSAYARSAEYNTTESDTGLFLGRSVKRTGRTGQITLDLLDPAWVRSKWMLFVDHAEIKPFFVSWRHEHYANEAVYAWTSGAIDSPSYDTPLTMQTAVSYRALL
jgi:hypothetical protein